MVYNAEQLEAAASGFTARDAKGRPAAAPRGFRRNPPLTPRVEYGGVERFQQADDVVPPPSQQAFRETIENAVRAQYGTAPRAFALVFVDGSGIAQTCTSDNLTPHHDRILRGGSVSVPEILYVLDSIAARRRQPPLIDAVQTIPSHVQAGPHGDSQVKQQPSLRNARPLQRTPSKKVAGTRKGRKRRRSTSDAEVEDSEPSAAYHPDASEADEAEAAEAVPTEVDWCPPPVTKSVQIGDQEAVKAFFQGAFSAIQQLGLKWILKQWIKAIEPKKQANFPYVLGNPDKMKERRRRQIQAKKGSVADEPELPKWWPEDVQYKEPDHIKKEERLRLAWNIIFNCDQDKAIKLLDGKYKRHPWTELLQSSTIDRVKLRTDKENADHGHEGREKFERRNRILDEVYQMAGQVEDFRSGGIDGTTVVSYRDEFSIAFPPKTTLSSRRSSCQRSPIADEMAMTGVESSRGSRKACSQRTVTDNDIDYDTEKDEPDYMTSSTGSTTRGLPEHADEVPGADLVSIAAPFASLERPSSIPKLNQQVFIPPREPSSARSIIETPSYNTSFSSMATDPYFEPHETQETLMLHTGSMHGMEWSQHRDTDFETPTHHTIQAMRFEQTQQPTFRTADWSNPGLASRDNVLRSHAPPDAGRWQPVHPEGHFDPSTAPQMSSVPPPMVLSQAPNAQLFDGRDAWAQAPTHYLPPRPDDNQGVACATGMSSGCAPPAAALQPENFYPDEWSRPGSIAMSGRSATHPSKHGPAHLRMGYPTHPPM